MEYDSFCENVMSLVLDQVDGMYEASRNEEWPAVESILRERLDMRNAFRARARRTKDYLKLLNENGQALYEELRVIRTKIAAEKKVPPYVVFSNRTLFEMSRCLPFTMDELKELYGVGDVNSGQYGQVFLDAIHAWSDGEREEMCVEEFLRKGEAGYPLIFGRKRRMPPGSGSTETEENAAGQTETLESGI